MLKNYLITIFRQIKKNKVFSFINIFGLALGMATWFAMQQWLQDYSFRIVLGWWFYLVPILFMIVMALLSILSKILSTIKKNPVESLRYE